MTSSTGGLPTTTMRTFGFSGGGSTTAYTCPADTICYLQLIGFTTASFSIPSTYNFSFYLGDGSSTFGVSVFNVTTNVSLGTVIFSTNSNLNLNNVYTRLDNPVANVAGTQLGGSVILYPGERLVIANTISNGTVYFSTLEVTSST